MDLEWLEKEFSVCKWTEEKEISQTGLFWFWARTDRELSLLCPTEEAPKDALQREDGWKGFRITGQLEFSLIGILAEIAGILAAEKISIFALSTYDTDYVFLKKEQAEDAQRALEEREHCFLS